MHRTIVVIVDGNNRVLPKTRDEIREETLALDCEVNGKSEHGSTTEYNWPRASQYHEDPDWHTYDRIILIDFTPPTAPLSIETYHLVYSLQQQGIKHTVVCFNANGTPTHMYNHLHEVIWHSLEKHYITELQFQERGGGVLNIKLSPEDYIAPVADGINIKISATINPALATCLSRTKRMPLDAKDTFSIEGHVCGGIVSIKPVNILKGLFYLTSFKMAS